MRYCSSQPVDDTDTDTGLPEIVFSRKISDERRRLPSTSRCSQQFPTVSQAAANITFPDSAVSAVRVFQNAAAIQSQALSLTIPQPELSLSQPVFSIHSIQPTSNSSSPAIHSNSQARSLASVSQPVFPPLSAYRSLIASQSESFAVQSNSSSTSTPSLTVPSPSEHSSAFHSPAPSSSVQTSTSSSSSVVTLSAENTSSLHDYHSIQGVLHHHTESVLTGNPYYLRLSRHNIFAEAVAFYKTARNNDLSRPLRVQFEGEDGVDAGGVRRDFFRSLFVSLLNREGVCLKVHPTNSGLFTTLSLTAPECLS